MSDPVVSIIIPSYNRADLIADTLRSVVGQSYPHWEVIVVDDHSTDGTLAVVRQFVEQEFRGRVRGFLRESRKKGAPVCRNEGLAASIGEYILFLDSDDLLAPQSLEDRIAVMEARPELDFVISRSRLFRCRPGDDVRLFNLDTGEDDLDRFLRLDYPWPTMGPLYRRSIVEAVGAWDEALQGGQDVDLAVRLLAKRAKYARTDKVGTWVRVGRPGTLGQAARSPERVDSHLRRIQTARSLLSTAGMLTPARRRMLAGNLFRLADRLAVTGQRRRAIALWSNAPKSRLCNWAMWASALPFLIMPRTAFAKLWMTLVIRTWHNDFFINNRGTFLKATIFDAHTPKVLARWEQPHKSYHVILRDGVMRQIMRSVRTRLKRIGVHSKI